MGLAKLPHLHELALTDLKQKRVASIVSIPTTRPPEYIPSSQVELKVASDIRHFLEVFVATFSTVLCSSPNRFTKT